MGKNISKSYLFTPLDAPMPEEAWATLVSENLNVIKTLFTLLEWNIAIAPPALIIGHPYGGFVNAELSTEWPSIVEAVVTQIGAKNVFSIHNAQSYCTPSQEEFGGCIHFTPEDHQRYGQQIAFFFEQKIKLERLAQELDIKQRLEQATISTATCLSKPAPEPVSLSTTSLPPMQPPATKNPNVGVAKQCFFCGY